MSFVGSLETIAGQDNQTDFYRRRTNVRLGLAVSTAPDLVCCPQRDNSDELLRNYDGEPLHERRVPQYPPSHASFTDLAAGSAEALYAESLRKEGVMGVSGTTFGATSQVNRLELAVAMVRALRMDAQAKALAGATVTSGGQPLTDNVQIPIALRGHVQLAIDRGLLPAFPAEVREIAPGQFIAIPGPRFEPSRLVKRVEMPGPLVRLLSLIFGE